LSILCTNISCLPPSSEIFCLIGDIFCDLGNIDNAIFFYLTSLQTTPDLKTGMFFNKEYYYMYPLLQLTYLFYKKGDLLKAQYYHNQCKKQDDKNIKVIYNEQFFSKLK